MNKKQFFILGVFIATFLLPEFAHAASASFLGPIIPPVCNCTAPASAPAWGCILATFQNLISFAVGFATIIITIFIALAGFTYMTSGGNAEKRQLANKRLANAVVGLLIVLCAYLLVDSIMKIIYNPAGTTLALGPWNSILGSNPGSECLAIRQTPAALPGLTGANNAASNAVGGTAPAGSTGPAAVSAPGASGLNISSAVSHLDSAVVASPGNGQCAQWVRQALDAGGFNDAGHPTNAKDYGPFLSGKGFSNLGSNDGSPQAGDVVVIQNYLGGSVPGHIAMYDGSKWVSDFVQVDFWGGPGYRKYQPAHEFYRP